LISCTALAWDAKTFHFWAVSCLVGLNTHWV